LRLRPRAADGARAQPLGVTTNTTTMENRTEHDGLQTPLDGTQTRRNYAGGAVHRVAETLGRLSPREAHVASLAADGYGALQIATRLGTSVHTVRRQLESVYRKCAIGNRAELASLVHTARQVTGFGAAGTKLRLRTHLARILGAFDLLPAVGPANWQVFG
jgi:DNA-binding CsgD family transcriptional regulator